MDNEIVLMLLKPNKIGTYSIPAAFLPGYFYRFSSEMRVCNADKILLNLYETHIVLGEPMEKGRYHAGNRKICVGIR